MKGLNLRAGTSYSSGKDAYAMSFEFPSYTSLYDDGKAYVCCCREVRLDRDLSFLEDMFTKNDSYKRLFCSYELVSCPDDLVYETAVCVILRG